MAFFEQLGKKLTDAGQGISQQTKNMADVARLNSTINDRKKQIASAYTALGEAYYSQHKEDANAEFSGQVAAINALYEQIRAAEEEIKQIRGVTKCEKCGADVPINAGFCSVCGAPVAQQAPVAQPAANPAARVCPSCGVPVAPGNNFCTCCGTRIEG